jgi:hypothetical protein
MAIRKENAVGNQVMMGKKPVIVMGRKLAVGIA